MKRKLFASIILFIIYALFTISLLSVDRKTIGPNESIVGHVSVNGWFQNLTGVHCLTDIVASCLLGDGLILLYEYLIIKSEQHALSVLIEWFLPIHFLVFVSII